MPPRAARSFLLRASLLAFAGLLLFPGRDSPMPPEVEYSGCWAFHSLPEPICTLWQSDPSKLPKLKLWVKTKPGNKVEIRADQQKLVADGKEVSGGLFYHVSIPRTADRLTISISSPDGAHEPIWSLQLAHPEQHSWLNEIDQLSAAGKNDEALRRLEEIQRSPREDQSFVWLTLANVVNRDGNNSDKEELYLKAGLAADLSDHCWSGVVEKATRLAGLYIEQGRFSEAEQVFNDLQPFPAKPPGDARNLVAFHRGLLGEADGDYRSALEQIQEANDLAVRLGLPIRRRQAEEVQARILQQLGRSQAAAKLFERILHDMQLDPRNPCDRGNLLTNVGWFWLYEHEAGKESKDPVPMLEQAQAEFEKNRCSGERLNARLNLAFAYQQAGRWTEAQQELDQARATHATNPNLAERLWWSDLEARAEIAKGHAERALDLYAELGRSAELANSPTGILRALLGSANAHLSLKHRQAAIDALAKADSEIEKQSRHVPVSEGLDTFFAYQEAATRLYLSLLLDDGQVANAFGLARRSRSRLLRQLAVRDRLRQLQGEKQQNWLVLLSKYHALRQTVDKEAARRRTLAVSEKNRAQEAEAANLVAARKALDGALGSLPSDVDGRLSPPGPDEVILAYHPLPEKRWVAFAANARETVVAYPRLPGELPKDPEQLASLLLKPSPAFQKNLAEAGRVRVLPYGPLRAVDFHALPFSGREPLLARHLVTYSLDLPVRPPSAIADSRFTALVVSNPKGDLPEANREEETVATAIEVWRPVWHLASLNSRAASSDAVLKALPESRFFHYAGHGTFSGFAGWDSELPLAGGTRLTLGDVLGLRSAPAWVVLSACDAARTSQEAPGEGIGLANAFLLAGSQAVVAATRSVPDSSANELMRELYGQWQRPEEEDLAYRLQRAQLAGWRKNPSPDAAWASFRLLVP